MWCATISSSLLCHSHLLSLVFLPFPPPLSFLPNAQLHPPVRRHLGAVNTVSFIDNGARIVSTSDDKSIRVWEWNVPVDTKHIAEPNMHSLPTAALHPSSASRECIKPLFSLLFFLKKYIVRCLLLAVLESLIFYFFLACWHSCFRRSPPLHVHFFPAM
jgi:WD40 repeat protein